MFLCILSCQYGGGHQRVAEAIADEWTASIGGPVEIVDYFTRFAGRAFDALARSVYYQAVRFVPKAQGQFYDFMDRIRPDSWFRRAVNRIGMARLNRYLASKRPDVVCCVHWTLTGTVSDLKAAKRTAVPCLAVITDYVSHGEWIHPYVDRYAVAHAVVRDGLLARGVPAERIIVSGLPTRRTFQRQLDRQTLVGVLGLASGAPVVLVMAGAFATLGRVGDVVQVLLGYPRPIQVLVVCANAQHLAERVRALGARSPHRVRVFGHVDNVDELMAVSDLLVTKAGGVTVSEALVARLPMLLYGSIPGQEKDNAHFLVQQGAALEARNRPELRAAVNELLAQPARLAAMRRVAARLSRPEAARTVVTGLAELAAGSCHRPPNSCSLSHVPCRNATPVSDRPTQRAEVPTGA